MDELKVNTFAGLSGNFESIYNELMNNNDPDLVMADFRSYVDAWEALTNSYGDRGDLEPQGPAQHRLLRLVLERPHHSRVPRRDLARVKARELPLPHGITRRA